MRWGYLKKVVAVRRCMQIVCKLPVKVEHRAVWWMTRGWGEAQVFFRSSKPSCFAAMGETVLTTLSVLKPWMVRLLLIYPISATSLWSWPMSPTVAWILWRDKLWGCLHDNRLTIYNYFELLPFAYTPTVFPRSGDANFWIQALN